MVVTVSYLVTAIAEGGNSLDDTITYGCLFLYCFDVPEVACLIASLASRPSKFKGCVKHPLVVHKFLTGRRVVCTVTNFTWAQDEGLYMSVLV